MNRIRYGYEGKIIIIIVDWNFFPLAAMDVFFCSTFSGKPLPIRIYLEHVWWSKKTAAAIINFGI